MKTTISYLLFTLIWSAFVPGTKADGPEFLPNSLEVEVEVHPYVAKSVHYVAQCDGVWLEFILTACDFESNWKVSVGFYSLKNDPNTDLIHDGVNGFAPSYHRPVASVIDQFHRKIVRINPENSKEGAYKVTLSGFTRSTTVRIFTSESDQSNYRDVFYPTSNVSSDLWASLDKSNRVRNMWLSWPPMSTAYENLGEHLTCVTVLSYSSFERCSTCAYNSMQDGTVVKYGDCVRPLFRKCATHYNYEPYQPSEVRYETEKMVGLVSKLHPVTGFITPYFKQLITESGFQEVANPYDLSYLTLRPKEEVKVTMEEINRMNWEKIYLIVMPCQSPVRVKVDQDKSIVKNPLAVFTLDQRSSVKIRNGHKSVTALRYFFTDDLTARNPISFTSTTEVNVDTSKTTCNSIALLLLQAQPETQYCAIAYQIKNNAHLSDFETPPCMNYKRETKDPQRRSWETCKITSGPNYYALDSFKLAEIVINGIDSTTDLAVEVFAKPINNFYPINIWSKVGAIFHARTLNC